MANEMQALFPVYLARIRKDDTVEDQDTFIAANENNMNQNFQILYNAYVDALERIKILEAK